MFLSGTVLCTINTLVEHGLKSAVPVKTASDHFAAAPPRTHAEHESFTSHHPLALRLHARELRARRAGSARVRRGARNPQSFHSTLCGPDLHPQCRPPDPPKVCPNGKRGDRRRYYGLKSSTSSTRGAVK